MCHVAAWLMKGVSKPPHGPEFKYYAAQVMEVFPKLNITTCHSYDINYKYQYQCQTEWCGHIYGRHSKSINTSKQRCGLCMGSLQLMPQLRADGTPRKQRNVNKFALYVKVSNPYIFEFCGWEKKLKLESSYISESTSACIKHIG